MQINIAQKERDYVRFLWQRISRTNDLEIYRHCRVVFGITSNPFLIVATIDFHLEQTLENTQDDYERSIIEKLRKSFYVDNCVTSGKTEEEINAFKTIATSVLRSGSFNLCGWEFSGESNHHSETSILGLTWNKQDVLMLSRATLL